MANVPASIEAEEALLGSILLYPQTQTLVFDEALQISDFFDEKHKKIYDAISELQKQQNPIDAQLLGYQILKNWIRLVEWNTFFI